MSTLASVVLRDVIGSRPVASIAGRLFFATDTGITYRDNGASWDVYGSFYGAGVTGSRPVVTLVGANYLDTTLHKPIWWDGANWRDASGNIV